MICRNCGNNIGDRVVCPYCGMQNQQVQQIEPKPPKKIANKGPMIIMILMVIMAIAVFVYINMNGVIVEEVEDSDSNSNSTVETNSNSTTEESSNESSNSSTNDSDEPTSNPDYLVCTQELNDIYGNYVYTYEYTFEYDNLTSYKRIVETNLNAKYINYRDELLEQYENADSSYQSLNGITIQSQKKSDGFIYTLKIIDILDVDIDTLKTMNLYALNYSSAKENASQKGLTCK